MLVAIIDTGIQPGIFPTGQIVQDLEVSHFGIIRKRKGKIHSFHGAFVAAVLEKYAPGCDICSIKIFDDETQTTTCKKLCAALRWCQRVRIPIINVSAGSVEATDFKKIGKTIDALKKNGQMIIAAYNNNGLPTMPAGHEAVIGVRTDPTLKGAEYVVDNTSSKRDYIASSQHELRSLWGKILFTSVSTSFAIPTVTAALIDKTRDSQRLE